MGRNIVSRLTALNRSMLAIAEGNLATNVPTGGNDEIAEMGGVVEILRKNTLERDELLIERAQAADRLEKQVEERTVELSQSLEGVTCTRRRQSGGQFDDRLADRPVHDYCQGGPAIWH